LGGFQYSHQMYLTFSKQDKVPAVFFALNSLFILKYLTDMGFNLIILAVHALFILAYFIHHNALPVQKSSM